MAHREILMLLIFCTLAWAQPFGFGIFDFGVGGSGSGSGGLQFGFGIDFNADPAPTAEPPTTEYPDKDDEGKPVPDANPLDIYINCSNTSAHLLKCVLRPNVTVPEIKARPFSATPKNTPIPTTPPKGMHADVKGLAVKGCLGDFIGSVQGLLSGSIGLGVHLNI